MLADALLRCGRAEEALDHLTEALETVQETPGYFYEPELHRLRAAALVALRPGQGVEEAGERCAGASSWPTPTGPPPAACASSLPSTTLTGGTVATRRCARPSRRR